MASVFERPGLSEILPRYVFLEPLVERRRVLEVDAVALTAGHSARFLAERGATQVVATDLDEEAVRFAAQEHADAEGVAFRTEAELEPDAGRFDLVVVHRCHRLVDNPERLEALARLLNRSGRLVLVVRHTEGVALCEVLRGAEGDPGPGYTDLADRLGERFESVEVCTQASFVGYSIAPSGVEEPDVAIDFSLAEDSPAAYYLFVCGPRPSGLDTVSVAALPPDPLTARAPPAVAPRVEKGLAEELRLDLALEEERRRLREAESRAQAALEDATQAQLIAAQALAERDSLKHKLETATERVAELERAGAASPDNAAGEAAGQLAEAQAAIASLRAEAQARDGRLRELEAESKAAADLKKNVARLEREIDERRERESSLEQSVQKAKAARSKAQEELEELRKAAADFQRKAEPAERAQAALEKAQDELKDLRKAVKGAQAERAEAELEAVKAAQEEAKALHQEVKSLESRLHEAQQEAQELQEQVKTAGAPRGDADAQAAALDKAREQVKELKASVKELEGRLAAELTRSGAPADEVERARAGSPAPGATEAAHKESAELREKLRAAESALDQAKRAEGKAHKDLDRARAAAKETEDLLAKEREHAEAIQAKLKAERKAASKEGKAREAFQREAEELRVRAADAEAEPARAREDREALRAAEERARAAEARVGEESEARRRAEAEADRARAEAGARPEADAEITRLRAVADRARADAKRLESAVEVARGDVEALRERLERAEEERSAAASAVEERGRLRDAVRDLEQQLAAERDRGEAKTRDLAGAVRAATEAAGGEEEEVAWISGTTRAPAKGGAPPGSTPVGFSGDGGTADLAQQLADAEATVESLRVELADARVEAVAARAQQSDAEAALQQVMTAEAQAREEAELSRKAALEMQQQLEAEQARAARLGAELEALRGGSGGIAQFKRSP